MAEDRTATVAGERRPAQPRIEYAEVAPGAIEAMRGLDAYVGSSGLERGLIELVKVRASQINGCAYCIYMHAKDARAGGESEQRLYALSAWWEAPFFNERERAALKWTEAVTRVADGSVAEEAYESVRRHFTEKELVDLTMAIVAINGWNRIAIGFGAVPGNYRPERS